MENRDLSTHALTRPPEWTFAANRGVDEARALRASPDPAIDLVHLARQTDGDEALEAELLCLFDRQAARALQTLADPELPLSARTEIAHKLRGSALAIGAARVSGAAEALEKACLSSAPCPLSCATQDLARAISEARAAIADLRD